MKVLGVAVTALLLAPAVSRVVPSLPRQYTATNITTLIRVFGVPRAVIGDLEVVHSDTGADPPPAKRPKLDPDPPAEPDPPAAEPQSEWDKYVCRGEKLTEASKLDKAKAEPIAIPIGTRWQGNLQAERKLWGYFDSPEPDCDFEGSYYDITRGLEELGVDDGECFRTQHYDPDKEDDIKDQRYTVFSKEYRATGAHATFGINVEAGAVFLIDVASAPRKAAQLWDVQKPPEDQLPALKQISDIAWGFWHQAHGGSNLGHITKFIVPQIINDITVRLIDEALRTYDVPDGEERHETVPEWPGISFEVDTPQGNALLGSPVGIAAAYFLTQHKSEIGVNKYVKKITVFRPDEDTGQDEPTIVYYVEDAPAPSQEDEKPARMPESNSRRALHVRNRTSARRDDVFATEEKTLWEKCVCRGAKLSKSCQADKDKAAQLATPIETQWNGAMEAELELWGYRVLDAMDHCNLYDIEDALRALKISTKPQPQCGANYCYEVRHFLAENTKGPDGNTIRQEDQTYQVNGNTFRMTGSHAIIGVNTVSGAIFFLDVRSAYHGARELWEPEVPTAETLPKLRAISNISWAFWSRAWMKQKESRRRLGNINYFIVYNIVNANTRTLIRHILETYELPQGQQRVTELPEWPGLTFAVDSEAGKALLGSPNGIAAGYFLVQHKAEIGANKFVYQVQIFSSNDWRATSMIMHVKDAPAPEIDDRDIARYRRQGVGLIDRGLVTVVNSSTPGSPSTAGDEVVSAGKAKLDDATLWNTCKCRGERITQASLQNKDTAISLVNPIDSEWDGTMEEELKLWGYRQPSGFSMYCHFDNVAGPLKEMGIDIKFKEKDKNGQNNCYQVLHNRGGPLGKIKEQTYVVDDKTYRMTNAIMQMGVNARDGMITYFNVRSAEQSAMITWRVEEVAADDLPKLNRVSDISWAFWKRANEGDDAGLKNIQKFHVHDAINEDTLRLVKMALKTYQVPEGDSRRTILPKWPGLVFKIESEEGLVMLGSPNGIAAGYFLVQHKTQLGGNKYIYQITLWRDDDGDVQMMFWVKDAPPPQSKVEEGRVARGTARSTRYDDNTAHAFRKGVRILVHSQDGRSIIREHRTLANL